MGQDKPAAWKRRLIYTHRDDRGNLPLVANNIILHLHPASVPANALRFTYTWGLGGASAVLFLLLVCTGLLLMFRYDARVDYAYISIQTIESQVSFGSLIRSIHHWSANLLVFAAFLHLLRVFFTGGFKAGRTANWLIGVALFILVLGANFTGYLLPWDQLAYWAITVSTTLLSYIPLVGVTLRNLLLGAPVVGQNALSNFYAIHVVFIPILMVGMIAYHFWKVRKNGGVSQPAPKSGERIERLTTIPHLIEREAAVALIVIAGVLVFAMLRPSPLGELADPFESPNPAKAAWYFLGLQELLLHMTPLAAIALVCLALVFLVIIPYWDRSTEDIGVYFHSIPGRWAALGGVLLALLLVPLLVVADEYWVNLAAMFPSLPDGVTGGLLPLILTLAGLFGVYALLRWGLRSQGRRLNHSEALLGLFSFVFSALIILTIVGIYFRGENMALVVPFL
jgi:quinol-cytochrome oxidoreductase complex cytochrome b subunit